MNISQLIQELQKIQELQGNSIFCCDDEFFALNKITIYRPTRQQKEEYTLPNVIVMLGSRNK